ncbi:LOW QUALITY PROTEIN: cobalt-zinc-cadmium resistance protein [Geomicrobium sp. JCM 19039]|nr:LOW QUALITY PROTEIN: cobalt-zinc-cadmium resistance protein [Geomicrobium sp. JCM 19039]
MGRYERLREGEKGAWLSIATYLGLAGVKLTIGYMFFSQALIADGYNNAADIVVSIAVLVGLRISQKLPDQDHPYGHFRAESIAALLAAFIIMVVGFQVLWGAGTSLFGETRTESPNLIAAWVAIGAATIMFAVSWYNKRLAKKINSQGLLAVSKDNRVDAFVSVGAFIGIIAAYFHLGWVDSLAALIIGLVICYTAWHIFRDAAHSLSDGFHEEDLTPYRATIEELEHVHGLKMIRARKQGSSIHADVVIEVEPHLSVEDSHEIATQIENNLKNEHEIDHTNVHVEPKRKK